MKTAFVSTLLLGALPVIAGTTTAPVQQPAITYSEPSEWEFSLALYGWLQSLDGQMAVLGNLVPVDIPFKDIWDDLDLTAMGAFSARYGRWGFTADMMYNSLGDSAVAPIAGRLTTVNIEQNQFLGNFALSYRAVETEAVTLGVYAGARVNWLEAELGGPFVTLSDDITWVDPIIGMRLQWNISPSLYFMALGDYGGFGVSSDQTWQAMAGFGYCFTHGFSAVLAYRGIGTDYTDGGFTYDIDAYGPVIGLAFSF